jgi:hypothetical protein
MNVVLHPFLKILSVNCTAIQQRCVQVISEILSLIKGTSELDPSIFGMTSDEEHTYLSFPKWPGTTIDVQPQNAKLKLFGGAAFERCICEFQRAAFITDSPCIARDKVANVVLAQSAISSRAQEDKVVQQIAANVANSLLLPLFNAATGRLACLLRRIFDIAKLAIDSQSGGPGDVLRMFVSYHATLQV